MSTKPSSVDHFKITEDEKQRSPLVYILRSDSKTSLIAGVASLPLGVPIELRAIFEVRRQSERTSRWEGSKSGRR
jgi:hypothetical protein